MVAPAAEVDTDVAPVPSTGQAPARVRRPRRAAIGRDAPAPVRLELTGSERAELRGELPHCITHPLLAALALAEREMAFAERDAHRLDRVSALPREVQSLAAWRASRLLASVRAAAFCRYYALGRCGRDPCRFRHGDQPEALVRWEHAPASAELADGLLASHPSIVAFTAPGVRDGSGIWRHRRGR